MHSRRKLKRSFQHIARYFGPINVVTRVDQHFDLIAEMTELLNQTSSKPINETQMRATIGKNICIAAYREGNADTPRELEGFIVAGTLPEQFCRIFITCLSVSDNLPLFRIFLNHLEEHAPGGICISVDATLKEHYQNLGFIVTKRAGSQYDMIKTR